ncbi:MAG TPA: hypothetical protein VMS96_01165 [Terriglobales bacterium]|nr:hypothetical protein [Terriglobales bacterium]
MRETPNELIEEFVAALNSNGLEPLFDDDVPQELRTKELSDISDMFEWEIRPAESNPWVAALEDLLPHSFPMLYRSLIVHYRFAEFEAGPIMFFANTGTDVFHELSRCIVADEGMYPLLHRHGFLQFGQQSGGGYDPVCFDTKRGKQGDAPVVQLDHEDVLTRDRIRVVAEIAPSFEQFVRRVISGEYWTGRNS